MKRYSLGDVVCAVIIAVSIVMTIYGVRDMVEAMYNIRMYGNVYGGNK